jgi:hypothetical protein
MGLVDSFVGAVFVYGFFVAVELAFGFECFAADLAGYAVYVYTAYGFLMGCGRLGFINGAIKFFYRTWSTFTHSYAPYRQTSLRQA